MDELLEVTTSEHRWSRCVNLLFGGVHQVQTLLQSLLALAQQCRRDLGRAVQEGQLTVRRLVGTEGEQDNQAE